MDTQDVPQKFLKDGQVDVAALAKAYREAEKTIHRRSAQTGPPRAPTEPLQPTSPEGSTSPAGSPPEAVIEAPVSPQEVQPPPPPQINVPGVTQEVINSLMQRGQAEWNKSGGLSREFYQLAANNGVQPAVIDQFIAGALAQQRQHVEHVTNVLVEAAGGDRKEMEVMLRWADVNLSRQQAAEFQHAVHYGSDAQRSLSMKEIKQAYERENGSRSNLLMTQNDPFAGRQGYIGEPFRTLQEFIEAQKDPKYGLLEANRSKLDPKYRKEVSQRLQASYAAGLTESWNLRVFENGKRVL